MRKDITIPQLYNEISEHCIDHENTERAVEKIFQLFCVQPKKVNYVEAFKKLSEFFTDEEIALIEDSIKNDNN